MQVKIEGSNTAARPCPICGKPARSTEQPFCSRRCADVDLHRWLSGGYALPTKPENNDDQPDLSEARPETD